MSDSKERILDLPDSNRPAAKKRRYILPIVLSLALMIVGYIMRLQGLPFGDILIVAGGASNILFNVLRYFNGEDQGLSETLKLIFVVAFTIGLVLKTLYLPYHTWLFIIALLAIAGVIAASVVKTIQRE